MPQYFIESSKIDEKKYIIKGDDYYHLVKVRRVSVGDIVDLCADDGKSHTAEIKEIDNSAIILEIFESKELDNDPINLTLCVSLLKGKSFDNVIRKAVEIGISKIAPIITERTTPDISKKEGAKIERWRKIALEASKQSMRNKPPFIEKLTNF